MKLIDRYVYAVTKNLPQKQREDIEKELRTLIEDMMNEYEEIKSNEEKAEKVLLELGDPNILAEKYGDNGRYLIGPQNFHNYVLVLKIVLVSMLFAVSVGYVVAHMFSAEEINIVNPFFDYLGSLFSGALQGFAWVTGIFAILEYKGVNIDKKNLKKDTWKISDLPEIPQNKALISRGESIFSIIFTTVFTMVFYFAPQYLGIYILKDSNYTVIPFFNVEVLNGYKILIFGVFFVTLIKEILKIIAGRWTLKLSFSIAGLDIAGFLILLTIFLNAGIFNSSLPAEFMNSANLTFDAAAVWNSFRKWFIVCFVVGYAVDIVTVMYKGIKYNN
jgi:hypothetical protein